jgi:tetratricopeptide (TPR) repeat protein
MRVLTMDYEFTRPSSSTSLTKADILRELLDKLEASIGQLGYGIQEEALAIPPLFDQVDHLLPELGAEGLSLVEEKARLDTLLVQLQTKSGQWLREVGGTQALKSARQSRQPTPEEWWWFLDKVYSDQRKRAVLRIGRWMGLGILVIALLVVVYRKFLAPSPTTSKLLTLQHQAEQLSVGGRLEEALEKTEQALTLDPGNSNLLIVKGVLQQQLGQSQAADETFQVAQAMFNDPVLYYLARAHQYNILSSFDAAISDTQKVLELNESSALGYLYMGEAYEGLKRYQEALMSYLQADQLATDQGLSEIAVVARLRYGQILLLPQLPTPESP